MRPPGTEANRVYQCYKKRSSILHAELNKEVASRGITVNAIAPGFIDTEMTQKLPENQRQELMARIPLGCLGSPEDVASAVSFLASDASGYITGQVLSVDGGMMMA